MNKVNYKRTLALILASLVTLGLASAAIAQGPMPETGVIWGTLTIDGEAADAGWTVEAMSGGTAVGSDDTDSAGQYVLEIPTSYSTVDLYVAGTEVKSGVAVPDAGDDKEVDLSVSSADLTEAPTADAGGPYTVDEDSSIELDGTGSTDPDGTIETYSWSLVDGVGSLQDASTSKPTYVAPASVDADTDATVRLTVTDNNGAMDTAAATIAVNDVPAPANEPPTADANGPYSVGEGESVGLDGTGSSDPDGDSLSYSWEIANDPTGGASLSDADSANPALQAPSVGGGMEITVELTVGDGRGHADTDTVSVTVRDLPREGIPLWPIAAAVMAMIVVAIAGIWYWRAGRSTLRGSRGGGGL